MPVALIIVLVVSGGTFVTLGVLSNRPDPPRRPSIMRAAPPAQPPARAPRVS